MRQRITYILRDPSTFNPSQIHVEKTKLTVKGLDAVKEHRLTFALEELPQEVAQVLAQSHELHIRWVKPQAYDALAPFVSRITPGLHAFFTPHHRKDPSHLCPLLKKAFDEDIKCDTPRDAFTPVSLVSERFAHSASSQFFAYVPTLKNLATYLNEKVCRLSPGTHHQCALDVAKLLSASYVDLDFDVITQALVLNAYWDAPPAAVTGEEMKTWTESVAAEDGRGKIEVGVLNQEKATDEEEISLGGFLTVVGEDEKAKATLFSFPARHHSLAPSSSLTSQTFSASFKQPTGLHPVLQVHVPSAQELRTPPKEDSGCSLHIFLTLPSYLFIDRYQLQDQLFLSSNNLKALHSLTGATDLEAPEYVVKQWGSSALIEVAPPSGEQTDHQDFVVSIPLHSRYLPPNSNSSGLTNLPVPWPVVFWACTAEEGTKMSVNPFDRVNVGYDALFGPRTMFYHIPPNETTVQETEGLVERLSVPVLDLDKSNYVEQGTMAAVLLGTVYVCWILFKLIATNGRGKTIVEKKSQ